MLTIDRVHCSNCGAHLKGDYAGIVECKSCGWEFRVTVERAASSIPLETVALGHRLMTSLRAVPAVSKKRDRYLRTREAAR